MSRKLQSLPAVACGRGLPECEAGPLEGFYADREPVCRTCLGGFTPHPEAVCRCCGSCCECKCGPRRRSETARRALVAATDQFQPCGHLERERCADCRSCLECDGCHCGEG